MSKIPCKECLEFVANMLEHMAVDLYDGRPAEQSVARRIAAGLRDVCDLCEHKEGAR